MMSNPISEWLKEQKGDFPGHEWVLDELAERFAEKTGPETEHTSFSYEPDLQDPAQRMAHRAMKAIEPAMKRAFAMDDKHPQITVVVSTPPSGRVAIATTEIAPEYALEALKAGWGAVHKAMRLDLERRG